MHAMVWVFALRGCVRRGACGGVFAVELAAGLAVESVVKSFV